MIQALAPSPPGRVVQSGPRNPGSPPSSAFLRGRPLPAPHRLSPRRGRTPRGEQRDKLFWMPETGDGETRGQFGAAPAPRRVPGRPAADRAPGAAAVAAPAAGARPGSASWGGSEGRGTDGRAGGRARGRTGGHALSREGVTGFALVKGTVHSDSRAHWADTGKPRCGHTGKAERRNVGKLALLKSRGRWGRTPEGTEAGAAHVAAVRGAPRRRGLSADHAQEAVRSARPSGERGERIDHGLYGAELLFPARPEVPEFASQLPQVMGPNAGVTGVARVLSSQIAFKFKAPTAASAPVSPLRLRCLLRPQLPSEGSRPLPIQPGLGMSLRITGSLPHGPSYALLLIAKGLAVGPNLPAKGRLSPFRPKPHPRALVLPSWHFPPPGSSARASSFRCPSTLSAVSCCQALDDPLVNC